MALNYVQLTVDIYDGSGNIPASGSVTFTPSATLTDTTDHQEVAQIPVTAPFRPGVLPVVRLLATDNGTLLPGGWGWTVTFSGTGLPGPYNFFLPFASGASQFLSSQTPVSSVTTMAAFLPIQYPTGAVSGYVWTTDGAGNGSWEPAPGAGGGMANPMTTLGDMIFENATPAAARLAGNTVATRKFLRQLGTGSASAAPAWDTIVAGDVPTLNQNTTGTAANVTATLDQIPAPVNPVSLNSKKITSLANGSAAQDAAAFGQIPAALPPNGAAGGVLSGSYPNPGYATTPLPQSGGTMTGWLAPAVVALTLAATIAVNAALGNVFTVTLTNSTSTLGNPTNPVDGQTARFRVIQDATGSRTLAYGTAYDFGAAGAPTLSTGANKVDILGFEYDASLSKWCYLGAGLGF